MADNSIQALGAYGYDPYLAYALNSYNANSANNSAQGTNANQGTQQTTNTTSTPSTGSNVAFQGNSTTPTTVKASDGSGIGTMVALGTLTAGAIATVASFRKGKKAGFEGFEAVKEGAKAIWKNFTGKAASEVGGKSNQVTQKVLNIIKDNGKNIQEYTIRKGENTFVIRNNKIAEIITKDKKAITDKNEVTKWLTDNKDFKTEYDDILDQVKKGALDKKGNNIPGKLPKGVQVSYEKIKTDPSGQKYKFIVENGKTKQVFKINGTDSFEIKGDSLNGFLKNHKKMTEEAETLKQSWTDKKIKLYDEKTKTYVPNDHQNIKLEIRNNKIVKATIGSGPDARELTDKELKLLKEDFQADIQNFSKQKNSYGGIDVNYTYRAKGGQKIKFDEKYNVTEISGNTNNLVGTDDVEKWLNKNGSIKNEIDDIIKTGQAPSGYQITNAIYKSDSGNVFELVGNKIKSVKLKEDFTYNGKTIKAGDELDKEALQEWRKVAENNNEYKSILDKLKNE